MMHLTKLYKYILAIAFYPFHITLTLRIRIILLAVYASLTICQS